MSQGNPYPDNSWFWPVLDEYRDVVGRNLEEAEIDWAKASGRLTDADTTEYIASKRYTASPKSQTGVHQMLALMESFFHPSEKFTYLEFGTCFGTTLAYILAYFKNAHAIGVEVTEARFDMTRWLVGRMSSQWNLESRVKLYKSSILDVPLSSNSIDVVFMDTDHKYPNDLEYIMYLLNSGVLRANFLFIGDDPIHTGTKKSREHFIAEQSSKYKIITRPDKNLWWFFRYKSRTPHLRWRST